MPARAMLLKGAVLVAGAVTAVVAVAPVAVAQGPGDPVPAQIAQDSPLWAPEAAGPQLAAPVPVTSLTCDGDTGKCLANLQYGDGHWVAQWPATVFHQ
jgi:hypothetical protein